MKTAGKALSDHGRRLPPRAACGFTLIEILLTLALIGLLSGALAVGVDALLKKNQRATPEDNLAQVMLACRELALNSDQTVQLRYDPRDGKFIWTNGTVKQTRDLVQKPPVSIQFLQPQPGASLLIGGQLVETREIGFVQFYRDGTCDAFRVQFQSESQTPHILTIDPWTCTTLPASRS